METHESLSPISFTYLSQTQAMEASNQNSSIEAEKKKKRCSKPRGKQKNSKEGQSSHQIVPYQHKHDQFDQNNQDDSDVEPKTQFGLNVSKKIKKEAEDQNLPNQTQTDDKMLEEPKQNYSLRLVDRASLFEEDFTDRMKASPESLGGKDDSLHAQNGKTIIEGKPKEGSAVSIEGFFKKLENSKGESPILYEFHSAREEDRQAIHQSLRNTLIQTNKHSSSSISSTEERKDEQKDLVTFKYFDFDLKNFTILEIMGQGGYGLVIKMREGNKDLVSNDVTWNHVVVKLSQKDPRFPESIKKDYINEVISLSAAQKAKQYSVYQEFDSDSNHFCNKPFETDQYYGMFLKPGIGSLEDFKNYLQKTKTKLTGQELFSFALPLLDEYCCLNKVEICHRDIKPPNIIVGHKFSINLSDFGLASVISKVKGDGGTPGYKMEDFKMEEYHEDKREDQIVSNDYFAIGKTILELAFPDIKFDSVGFIRSGIKKLKLSREKKIIANMIETCIFGELERKKDVLKEYNFAKDYWRLEDGIEKEELKEINENFKPDKFSVYRRKLKEKHLHRFKKYMANKLALDKKKAKKVMSNVSQGLASKEIQAKKDEAFLADHALEIKTRRFDVEEQCIKNYFLKYPKGAMKMCWDILVNINKENYQTVNPQFYSTLKDVLFKKKLDSAINLGENAFKFWGFDHLSAIFLNNLAFLERQMNLESNSDHNEYEASFKHLVNRCNNLWFEDLKDICVCASYGQIELFDWSQERIEKNFRNGETKLILADFEMNLEHQESYLFMNFCFVIASQIDQIIDESTRNKIQKFVYGVNISEREAILQFLGINDEETVLFTLMSFCDTFQDTTEERLAKFKDDAKKILLEKDALSICDLLSYKPTQAMLGFIILYNLNYDLVTKFDFDEWTKSEEFKELEKGTEEEINQRYQILRDEQDRKWNKQQFLDSVLLFRKKVYGQIIEIPLLFEDSSGNEIFYLSIFGKEIESLFLPYPAVQESYSLRLDHSQNIVSVSAVKVIFVLSEENSESNSEFFIKFSMRERQLLQRLSLEISDYDGDFSAQSLQRISRELESCNLKELKIKMKDRVLINDQGIDPLLKFISTQTELNYLLIELNQCQITSRTIKSLAKSLKKHRNLKKIYLFFQLCLNIDEKSILYFLDEMKNLSQLKIVGLFFGACSGITSLIKPSDLPFKLLIPSIQLIEEVPFQGFTSEGYFEMLMLEKADKDSLSEELMRDLLE